MEHPKHEMDGGPAGFVAAAGLVDALRHAPGQLFQPTGVDVLEHHLQRLAPDLKSGHHLSEFERHRPRRELVAEEGAPRGQHAAVDRQLVRGIATRGSDGDAGVGAEGQARVAEEGSEVLRQAAERGHLGGDRRGVAQAATASDAGLAKGSGSLHGQMGFDARTVATKPADSEGDPTQLLSSFPRRVSISGSCLRGIS